MTFFKKKSFLVCVVAGECVALVLTALFTLAAAWAVIREILPEAAGAICAAAAAGISVLVPTAVIVRSRGREALAIGSAIAGGYVLLAALFCALGGDKCAFGPWIAYLAGSVLAGGLAGAMVCVRHNSHRKKRH